MKRLIPFASLLAVSLFLIPSFAQNPVDPAAAGTSPAVTVPDTAAVDVAGVILTPGTRDERRALLLAMLDEKLDTEVNLIDEGTVVTRKRRDLGIILDVDRMLDAAEAQPAYVPLMLDVDLATSKAALRRIAPSFDREKVDAKPYMYNGEFHLRPSVDARALNVPTTAELIRRALRADATVREFPATVTREAPKVTSEDLAGIDGMLATYATTTTSNANRNHNVALAARFIDGTILPPGATFSLNETVGERTIARGFKEAIVFENARPVPGVGGGVSQVTGTLFNAAALAGLKIEEVNPHSRPVSYLALGRDATVAWRQKDLRFLNNTDAPIYMEYTFHNRHLQVTLYGKTVQDREISLIPQVKRYSAGRINAQLYRTIKNGDDKIIRERILSHTYRWDPST